ncbi:MAG: hypothetical protein KF903_06185 [Dokdonella sp.]|uniref:hypothetical protein n=1 Tax=Dokdonella sp. TaxID=2291710 RepID=UPI0025C00A53|nr:hypothetical protein [Dokdonella sp.]MBX3700573.1 hypothetical protein [Dokdonella sp.]
MRIRSLVAQLIVAAIAGFCFSAFAAPPAGPEFRPLGRITDYFQGAGSGGIAKADFDQDGADEMVFGAASGDPLLYVVGDDGSGVPGIKQSLIITGTSGQPGYAPYATILAWEQGAGAKLVAVTRDGTALVFSGWPLAEEYRFAVAGAAVAAAIGDVDADGNDELLVLTQNGVHVYSMASGAALWSHAITTGSDIALAQLDADPALEIVITGSNVGIVLDGATRATEWSYADGFGQRLATGVFTAGGMTQWVGAKGWYWFSIFGSSPWSRLWDYATQSDIGAIATGDLDGAGIDSILYGDSQWGKVHIINPATHQERFSIPYDGFSVRAIAIANLLGGNNPQIGFLSASTATDGGLFTLASAATGGTVWQFESVGGPYRVTAVGDVDGDGADEIVAATGGSQYNLGVSVYDFVTGQRKWQSPPPAPNADDPFYMLVRRIKLVPRANAPGMNIVLAGSGTYYGKAVVIDGVDKHVIRQIGHYQTPSIPDRAITGIGMLDFDHDGVDDFVFATAPSTTATSGAKLFVVSGTSEQILWESIAMGSGFSDINDVLVIPPQTAGAASELVAVLPGSLRAYNSQTLLLDWVIPATNTGAAYIADGVAGPEFVTWQTNGAVTFYDAATQAYLRAFSLASPLSALTVLQGGEGSLLAAADNRLELVAGNDGSVLAASDPLGELWSMAPLAAPAAVPTGTSSWHVALASQPALWRMQLDATDRIFLGTFDSP